MTSFVLLIYMEPSTSYWGRIFGWVVKKPSVRGYKFRIVAYLNFLRYLFKDRRKDIYILIENTTKYILRPRLAQLQIQDFLELIKPSSKKS